MLDDIKLKHPEIEGVEELMMMTSEEIAFTKKLIKVWQLLLLDDIHEMRLNPLYVKVTQRP